MDIVLDTNVLVRCIQPAHPHHQPAQSAIASLIRRGDRLCILPQILYEFFVVCTRPQQVKGGLGMSSSEGVAELRRVESLFVRLPEPADAFSIWVGLIERHAVQGKPAHDARIVAALSANRITTILTFNGRDFARYEGVTILDPLQIATG